MAATKEAPQTAETKEQPIYPLPRNSLGVPGHMYNTLGARAPTEWTREYVERNWRNPQLWSVVGDRLQPGDCLHILGAKAQWWASFVIGHVEQGRDPAMQLLQIVDLPVSEGRDRAVLPAGHRIDFDPQRRVYDAIREKDGALIVHGASSWDHCRSQLVNHASVRGTNVPQYF